MAGVQVTIPGQVGILESRQAMMDAAVREQFSLITPTVPDTNVRGPSASNIGRPLTTARLG